MRNDLFKQNAHNFKYHAPKGNAADIYEGIREKARELADMLADICPDSRERSLAITKIEEAVMWANASIARS